jgi:hypothetical protein
MLKAFLCAIALLTLVLTGPVDAQEPATSPSIKLLGTDCDIVLGRAKFQQPSNCSELALLAEIETWLSAEFDLPAIREHPRLKLVSPAAIAGRAFEAQIYGVIESTVGMYGDLQGIAGKALQEIEGLQIPLLEGSLQDETLGGSISLDRCNQDSDRCAGPVSRG